MTLFETFIETSNAQTSLERIGVKVSQKRSQLECAVYTAVVIAAYAIRMVYVIFRGRSHHSYGTFNTAFSKYSFFVKSVCIFPRRVLLLSLIHI